MRFVNFVRVAPDETRALEEKAALDVFWLEQAESDVPAGNQWLSAGEALCLSGLRFPKRRTDWRLGRWTAKRALAACLQLPTELPALANIEIRAASSGAPEAFLFNQPAPVTISLSHRAGIALCAVAPAGMTLGCDLETIEPRSDVFVTDYFTANEQALVERASAEERPRLVALLWSAKESVLKALLAGLRLDTNSLEVNPGAASALDRDPWRPLQVRYVNAQIFYGWWRAADNLVRTVVSADPLHAPIPCK